MVLLDYSKAFDTIWRSKLLLSMAEKGVPIEYVSWMNSFLQNRQARGSDFTTRPAVAANSNKAYPRDVFYPPYSSYSSSIT